jgi:hypothetical protein
MAIKVRCPHCDEALEIDDTDEKSPVECPACRKVFVWAEVLAQRQKARDEERRRAQAEQQAREEECRRVQQQRERVLQAQLEAAERREEERRRNPTARIAAISSKRSSDDISSGSTTLCIGSLLNRTYLAKDLLIPLLLTYRKKPRSVGNSWLESNPSGVILSIEKECHLAYKTFCDYAAAFTRTDLHRSRWEFCLL